MTRTMKFATLTALPLTALSVCALAQNADPAGAAQSRPDFFQHMLEKMDTNGDGKISLNEYLAAAGARFKSIDTQNKGSIDAADIASSPAAVARIDHRAQAMVKHLDKAGNGYVTQDEFLAVAQKRFTRMDKNGDGKLTPDELATSHGSHGGGTASAKGDTHAAKRFAKLDTNHDGVVTQDEFLAAATTLFKQLDTAGTGKLTAAEIESSPKTQDRAIHVADHIVKHMDTNGNGVVSQDEYLAAAKTRFAKIDKNGDGYIESDEMPAHRWAHGAKSAHNGG